MRLRRGGILSIRVLVFSHPCHRGQEVVVVVAHGELESLRAARPSLGREEGRRWGGRVWLDSSNSRFERRRQMKESGLYSLMLEIP
jgi:hypothetical protein